MGQLAPRDQLFCPYPAVVKFPYKYVRGADSDRVSKAYFAEGKFRARGWTLFYIYTLLDTATKPLIVVPAAEVEDLLFEINSRLNLQLGFPHPSIEPGFLISFLTEGCPRPRYLGRLTTENDLETMESKIPGPSFKQDGEDVLDPRSFPAFRDKMRASTQAGKNKSKASKEKKKRDRIVIKRSWCDQLKRVQCYLGLRPRWSTLTNPHSIPNLTWEEEQKAMEEDKIARASRARTIDVTKPVPNSFHDNVIFIAIDVESYERERTAITEIGVSTLDTSDLADIPPGKGGVAWMKKIRSRHFRIKEFAHLVNSDFIIGCADKFEKEFGTSEWISIKEAPQVIASCFKHPYSDPNLLDHLADNLTNEPSQTPSRSNDDYSLPAPVKDNDTASKRNIILVGHGIKADIEYLRSIGYDVLSGIREPIDTADMFRAVKHEQQPRSLGSLLLDLELVGWNLHNAGNDAAYTLQAMIGMCFKSRRNQEEIAKERDARMEDAAKEAKEQARQDGEEWIEADNDEGDGGEPAEPKKQEPALNPRNGGSNVNRAERSAREKIETKKRKDQEEAAAVASGDTDTRDEKNAVKEWADKGFPASSDVEGLNPSNGSKAVADGRLSHMIDQEAVSSADCEGVIPPDGAIHSTIHSTLWLANVDDYGRTLSVDQGPLNSAGQGILASDHKPLKPSNEVPDPADGASIQSGSGFDGMQEMSAREKSHTGPIQAAEAPDPPQNSTMDVVKEESVPIPARMLERLALLEALDAEDGGVRL